MDINDVFAPGLALTDSIDNDDFDNKINFHFHCFIIHFLDLTFE